PEHFVLARWIEIRCQSRDHVFRIRIRAADVELGAIARRQHGGATESCVADEIAEHRARLLRRDRSGLAHGDRCRAKTETRRDEARHRKEIPIGLIAMRWLSIGTPSFPSARLPAQ